MTISFTEEQDMIRESVRDWAQSKLAPIALEMEKTREIPKDIIKGCLLYTSPSPRDRQRSRMPSSA